MSDTAGVEQPLGDGVRFTVATDTDGISTVMVTGDVDLLTAPAMASAVVHAQERAQDVLLDLTGVDFLGSAGLSVMVEAARRADDSQGRLAVLVTHRPVRRAIEVTGLDAALHLFDSVDAAKEYLTASREGA